MDSNRQAALLDHHRQSLHARALTDEQIAARGYRSITDTKDDRQLLADAGITKPGRRVPGLLIPLRRADGTIWGHQYKPDHPRIGNDGRVIKYETPQRLKVGLDVPPGVGLARLTDPGEALLITEGVAKADAGAVAGLKIVGLLGVWNWLHTNDAGGKAIISELYELAVNGCDVVLAFDADIVRKFSVQKAAGTLGSWLTSRGARIGYLLLPDGLDKVGLDDFLAQGHTAADVMKLVSPDLPPAPGGQRSEPSQPKPEFGSIDGAPILNSVARWLERFIRVTHADDIYILALWVVHTHLVTELRTSPRLQIDSLMFEAGKSTVLEHAERLCANAVLAATLSSPALIPRMLSVEMTTLLLDEIDRTLHPDKPGIDELLAVVNTGYRIGAARPVLVPGENGQWVVEKMPTYAPVMMAGNNPRLPDDTKSRSIRIILIRDIEGFAEETDWEVLETDARELHDRIADWADSVREVIGGVSVELDERCRGRSKEKWRPLKRVAVMAGGRWPDICDRLIKQSVAEDEAMRGAGLETRLPSLILLDDLHTLWHPGETFMATKELVARLVAFNAAYWGANSPYGRELTEHRFARLIAQAAKLTPETESIDVTSQRMSAHGPRGYLRQHFGTLWDRLGVGDPKTQLDDEQVDDDPPSESGTSATNGTSGTEDEPLEPDKPDEPLPKEGADTHSLIDYCMDCGTELTDVELAPGYCQECLDEREEARR